MTIVVGQPQHGSVSAAISPNAQRETQCWSRLEVGAAELPAGT